MSKQGPALFLIFVPTLLGIPAVRFIIYIVSVPAESLARFDPPGMDRGTLSPGFGPGPDRAGRGGAPDIISRLDRDRLRLRDAPGK